MQTNINNIQYNLFYSRNSYLGNNWSQYDTTYNNMEKIRNEYLPKKIEWLNLLNSLIERALFLKQSKQNKDNSTRNLSVYDRIVDIFQKLKDPFGLPIKDRLLIYSVFISQKNVGQVTFIDIKNVYYKNLYKSFSVMNRKSSKFITFLKKFQYFGLSKAELPIISDIWLNVYNDEFKIQYDVISGDSIVDLYNQLEIPNNCMQSNPNGCLDFYSTNPDRIKLLVGYKNATPVSRALLWKIMDDAWYLDRNYTNGSGSIPRYMIEPVINNDEIFILKTVSGAEYKIIDMAQEDSICTPSLKNKHYKIKGLELGKSGRVPYLDSFQWGDYHSERLFVTNDQDYGSEFCFESTDGTVVDPDKSGLVWCDYDNIYVERDEAIQLSNGYWHPIEDSVQTEDGWYRRDNAYYIYPSITGYEYAPHNRVVWADIEESYIHKKDAIHFKYSGKGYITHRDTNLEDITSYLGITDKIWSSKELKSGILSFKTKKEALVAKEKF